MIQLFNLPGIVPVELIAFTTSVKGITVSLSWSKASELNN